MELEIKVKSMKQEDLVDFLSTALYGNGNYRTEYNTGCYNSVCKVDEDDCFEEKCAKVLLAGGDISIADMLSEDSACKYGDNPNAFWSEQAKAVVYPIKYDDIIKGLNKAAANGYAMEVLALADGEGDFDALDADSLLQFVLYGELIYG